MVLGDLIARLALTRRISCMFGGVCKWSHARTRTSEVTLCVFSKKYITELSTCCFHDALHLDFCCFCVQGLGTRARRAGCEGVSDNASPLACYALYGFCDQQSLFNVAQSFYANTQRVDICIASYPCVTSRGLLAFSLKH